MPDEDIIIPPIGGPSHDYKRLFEATQKQVKVLEQRLQKYEFHGGYRLYYSLNRKANEVAEALNNNAVTDVLEGDVKEKKFERLRALWTDAEKIVTAMQAIATMLNITNNEEADYRKKVPFIETVAETRT